MEKIHKSGWTLIKQKITRCLYIWLWLSTGQTSDSIAFQSVYWLWPPIFALSGRGCNTQKQRSTHFSLQDETAEVMSSNRINQSTLANINTKRRQNNRKKYRVHLPLVHIESCFFCSCCSVSRSPWLLLGAMKTTLNIHKTNLEGATIIYEQKATENCVQGVRWSTHTPHRSQKKMQRKVVNIQNKRRIRKEKRNILRLLLLCFAQRFMLLGVFLRFFFFLVRRCLIRLA